MVDNLLLPLLAAYRLTVLVVEETGPFGIAERLRSYVANAHPGTWLDEGVNCPYCVSFWASLIVFAPRPLVRWLALAGLYVFLHRVSNHD